MTRYILIALILISCALMFGQEKESRLAVKKGGSLTVKITAGDIHLETWEKDEFLIRYDEELKIRIEKTGNVITITTSNSEGEDLYIKVPSEFSLDVNTMGGDITLLNDIKGKIDLVSSGGDIHAGNISGQVTIATGGGNVSVNNIKGKAVLTSAGGDMHFGEINGQLKVTTAGGNVSGGSVTGPIVIATAGGSIEIKNLLGMADVVSGGGDITIGNSSDKIVAKTGGGDVNVKSIAGEGIITSESGNLTIKKLTGSVKAKTNGGEIQIGVSSDYKGNSEIMTGSGNVKLEINENANVKIITKIAGEDISPDRMSDYIRSDFKGPLSVNVNGSFAETVHNINRADNTIKIKITNGQVYLKKTK